MPAYLIYLIGELWRPSCLICLLQNMKSTEHKDKTVITIKAHCKCILKFYKGLQLHNAATYNNH